MKRLHERTQKLPVTEHNQPVKADHARVSLDSAEQMLEAEKSGAGSSAEQILEAEKSGAGRSAVRGMFGMMAGAMNRRMNPNRASIQPADPRVSEAVAGQSASGASARQAAPAPAAMMRGMELRGGGGVEGGGVEGSGMAVSADVLNRRLRRSIASSLAELEASDDSQRNLEVFHILATPISMSFNEETPLEDVLKYLKQSTVTDRHKTGIQIYVDPRGLEQAEKSMTSTVRALDLEGVPLKTTLRLLLRQLDLAYCVRDGVLMISSIEGISDELAEEREVREAKNGLGSTQ
jgi:hypothetical protein